MPIRLGALNTGALFCYPVAGDVLILQYEPIVDPKTGGLWTARDISTQRRYYVHEDVEVWLLSEFMRQVMTLSQSERRMGERLKKLWGDIGDLQYTLEVHLDAINDIRREWERTLSHVSLVNSQKHADSYSPGIPGAGAILTGVFLGGVLLLWGLYKAIEWFDAHPGSW